MTPLRRVERMFASRGWRPFPFQRRVWRAYAKGHSGLVHSPTGSGKTLAVWGAVVLQWLREHPDASGSGAKKPPPIRTLWVTPLRALSGDTENALRGVVDALGLPWRLECRTGDSSASLKARQLRRLPTALITTPESLALMLSHPHLVEPLAGLESVIVDEWHELLGTKRGVQTELCLARLRRLNPGLRTWGLSATLGDLGRAGEALVGVSPAVGDFKCEIVEGFRGKRVRIESMIPEPMERFPWGGHIGTAMVPQVASLLDEVESALIFANTRSQTEIWYQQLLAARPDLAGTIAVHHGSLDPSVRRWVESGLRDGRLKAVVCTSSLDLGVDFTAVDLVVQIGSPKGAARLLQRAGRSGHRPGAESRLVFVPTHAIELLELAAARGAIAGKRLESRPRIDKPLDVLVQHAVTVAIGGGFESGALLEEVRTTAAYESLSDAEWAWVLDFVTRGGPLEAYPEFRRVEQADDRYVVTDRHTIRRHRLAIGTIVSDAAMRVKFLRGGTLGTAEETFVSKIKPGERFLFAGRVVELVRVRDNIAYVRKSTGKPDAVPRWMGGRMPLSGELSEALRGTIGEVASGNRSGPELRSLERLFELQSRWSRLPRPDEVLVERVRTRQGDHVFVFPFEGRLVHEGLAAVVALRLGRQRPISLSMACNDYGFVLRSAEPIGSGQAIGFDESAARRCLARDGLVDDILASMNATEMEKRQFREIARIAGLLQPSYPGRPQPNRNLQASSNLFFDVFRQYDPGNLLLQQGRREVLERQLEASRLEAALRRIERGRVVITDPPRVTPLAFPLLVDQLRERLSTETLAGRIAKLQASLDRAADTAPPRRRNAAGGRR